MKSLMRGKGPDRETRERLLEAAGEVFAERGFRAATVREICRRARANVAAVNYHFHDKERLYAAVFEYAGSHARQEDSTAVAGGEKAKAEERLRQFIRSYFRRIFDTGRPAWLSKLVVREMTEPTNMLDAIVNKLARPNHLRLRAIIRELLPQNAPEDAVRQCALSVVGQCIFYHNSRAVISRLYPEQKYTAEAIEQLSEHVFRFSLGALQEYQTPRKKK